MPTQSLTHRAFGYKRWADERTLAAIALLDETNSAESLAFAHQQLNHTIIVQELFTSRLLNQSPPHASTNTDALPGFAELEQRLLASDDWYLAFVSNDHHPEQTHQFKFADGKRGAMSTEEILFHILTHGAYHRGNIAHCLDTAGVAHPIDGYGIYIHATEPERRA